MPISVALWTELCYEAKRWQNLWKWIDVRTQRDVYQQCAMCRIEGTEWVDIEGSSHFLLSSHLHSHVCHLLAAFCSCSWQMIYLCILLMSHMLICILLDGFYFQKSIYLLEYFINWKDLNYVCQMVTARFVMGY